MLLIGPLVPHFTKIQSQNIASFSPMVAWRLSTSTDCTRWRETTDPILHQSQPYLSFFPIPSPYNWATLAQEPSLHRATHSGLDPHPAHTPGYRITSTATNTPPRALRFHRIFCPITSRAITLDLRLGGLMPLQTSRIERGHH